MTKTFPVREGVLRRVQRPCARGVGGVAARSQRGETLGLVGESGSGKSTLGRLALRLSTPTSGEVFFEGEPLAGKSHAPPPAARPDGVPGPVLVVRPAAAGRRQRRPSRSTSTSSLSRAERTARLHELGVARRRCRPSTSSATRSELSGGQLQRLAMARALAVDPKLVVLDEPVSSLDVSTQAQVINLLEKLQRELGVAYLFIAHNPALVRHASDHIAVMYLGEIVEIGAAEDVYSAPKHPYTQALLSAVVVPDPEVQRHATSDRPRGRRARTPRPRRPGAVSTPAART